MGATQQLARRLAEIENAVIQHDDALRHLFDVIKPLLQPPPDPRASKSVSNRERTALEGISP
jgi:hypothetical protein